MDARRVTALLALGLVGAVVVGLIATADDGEGAPVATSAPDTEVPVDAAAASESPAADAAPPDDSDIPTETTADGDGSDPTLSDVPELENLGPHPEFQPVQEWIQTDATSFDDFSGKVIAVQFWTFGCHNCQATWPHMRELYATHGGDDFEIVGVHAPEFDFERDVDAVAAAAEENGLTWPIAIDNDKLNFRSWQERRFWPRIFLLDRDGNIRYDHIGEGAYDEIDAAVGALIAEGP